MFRPATHDDTTALLAMMSDFNQVEGIEIDVERTRAGLARLLADRALGVVIVAEDLGAYAVLTWGFDLEFGGPDAFLTEIWVREDRRRGGVGAALLAAVESAAQAHGAAALHLMVRPENAPAVALYARAGYTSPPRTFLTKHLG